MVYMFAVYIYISVFVLFVMFTKMALIILCFLLYLRKGVGRLLASREALVRLERCGGGKKNDPE